MKELGYQNIKIYNGGIKDWEKAGFELKREEALPEYKGRYITSEELLTRLNETEKKGCVDAGGKPMLTILDLRTEHHFEATRKLSSIDTSCPTLELLLDDLQKQEIRDKVPKDGLVVTVTETGNRDIFAMKFMYKYGYTNIVGLNFGMRGWIKPGYPEQISE